MKKKTRSLERGGPDLMHIEKQMGDSPFYFVLERAEKYGLN